MNSTPAEILTRLAAWSAQDNSMADTPWLQAETVFIHIDATVCTV